MRETTRLRNPDQALKSIAHFADQIQVRVNNQKILPA